MTADISVVGKGDDAALLAGATVVAQPGLYDTITARLNEALNVYLSQLLKEGLRDSENLDGLLVLLDTCYAGVGAAQAAIWRQVGLGRRQRRYELLTASSDQPAYRGGVTKTVINVIRAAGF